MAICSLTDFRVLIVPGLHGSGPDHWQTRWQELHPAFERVHQERWDVPDLLVWSARLDQVLRRSARPTLIIAHSFGCLTTVHRASHGATNLHGVLLVAPADPVKFGVDRMLQDAALPCPAIVVGSTNDPWMESDRAVVWAERWGGVFVNGGALGHINAESELGDWPYGQSLLQRLVQQSEDFSAARAPV
ncbi:alpha/beta hydrolase [Noviherbaspirillum cavernae]|uniref:Alpha/beta hydrolase n=1 Tax=Noviherbaspirillum cavernae TaxID=2320862 RepID=A0A418WZ95_9BURK|nr:alpha/beta hydrolase [Noviherbaspirillum cavernae]RJG05522.1 alpha/beta hydrolase [Noviherbaspirillum cavernae]